SSNWLWPSRDPKWSQELYSRRTRERSDAPFHSWLRRAPHSERGARESEKAPRRDARRRTLFVGAMVAARSKPHLKSFRDKRVSAGKPKLGARVAVARKLTTILNAILRDRRPWQPIRA